MAERECLDTLVQQLEASFKYRFRVAKYLIIPESDDSESFLFEEFCPPFIRFHGEGVLPSIQLDDQ
jgi:hypothetical protein